LNPKALKILFALVFLMVGLKLFLGNISQAMGA